MAKNTKKKKSKQKKNKIQTVKNKQKIRKKLAQKRKIYSMKNSRRDSSTRKSRIYHLECSSDGDDEGNKRILLPKQLLLEAKSKISKNLSISSLRNAMKIYDIDEKINYNFLDKCKKISYRGYKYLYTLNCEDRKKIINKHKIDQYMLRKSSKIIFFELIKFLIALFIPNNKESLKSLEQYKLQKFGKFIIPISEGNEELKFSYFIDIVLSWLKKKSQHEMVKARLSYFSTFFNNRKNMDKIEEVFYRIFRIDLLFFNNITDNSILENVKLSIEETLGAKKAKLKLIKEKIKENIDSLKITNETYLTLKENNYNFKPSNYFFGKCYSPIHVIKNIVDKNNMSYNYFKLNKINYFDEDFVKKNVFVQLVNKILSSNVIKEYYQKVNTYHEYKFPFSQDNANISDYLWDKVIYADLDNKTWGISNKEGFGIFINRNNGKNLYGLGYGANIITITHEFIGHCIRIPINSNNKLLAGTNTPHASYIEEEDNKKTKAYNDGGDKFEALIFGKKVTSLTIAGNHFLLDLDNWNLSLNEFQTKFKKNNVLKDLITLKKELANIRKQDLVKKLFTNINYTNVTNKIESQSIPLRSNYISDLQTLDMEGFR